MKNLLAPLGLPLSPHQISQLERYAALLREANERMNLIAPSTVDDLEQRHILDSAQLAPHFKGPTMSVLDVGSGGGLPGIILAILCPQHHFTLAEKVGKKAKFLQSVVDDLKLTNVTVWSKQVAELKDTYNIITCRAWAALDIILTTTRPLLRHGGSWWLLKGEAIDAELEACTLPTKVTMTRYPSITHPNGVILHLTVSRGTHTR